MHEIVGVLQAMKLPASFVTQNRIDAIFLLA